MTNEQKSFELSSKLFVLVVVFLVGLMGFWGFRVYEIWRNATGNYAREMSVEGTGKAYVVSDVATIQLGFETKGKTAGEVVNASSKTMNNVQKELEKLGVEKKDIKTTSYYLNPNYNWTDAKGSFQDGYVLNQTVLVKIRNFDKIGDIIAKSTEVGANTVNDLQFTVDDPEKAKEEARAEAIAKAKEKAELIAEQAGFDLGGVLSYYEYSNDYYGKGGMVYEAAMAEGGGMGGVTSPQIQPGEQEVSLTVSLSYRIYY